MSDAPALPPAPPPPPKSRRWFVVLAWATLIGFALFVGGVTGVACNVGAIQKARVGR
jgi:hypothetical protein